MKKTLVSILFTVILLVLMGCPEGLDDMVEVVSNPLNLLEFRSSYYDFYTYEAKADMFFPTVEDFGATRFILYSSNDKDGPYSEFKYLGERFDTDDDDPDTDTVGFSIPVPLGGAWFKLLIEGGKFGGKYSNSVYAPYCSGAAYCEIWGLGEEMFNTGIMAPHVGYGLKAYFTIEDIDRNLLEDVLDYQWYRVDPNNWEDEELIEGATSLEYTTTNDDVGYQMLIRASGKSGGAFAGGLVQQYSVYRVVVR